MTTQSPSVLADIAGLIRAVAALLWPALGIYVVIKHEKQLRDLLARLRKGKLLGQEIELDSSLKELHSQATLAQEQSTPPEQPAEMPDGIDVGDEGRDEDEFTTFENEILVSAKESPTVALMQLAAKVERLASDIWSDLDDGSYPSRVHGRQLLERLSHVLPASTSAAVRTFWNVRNLIVHGRDADDEDVISAVDSGLLLWRSLNQFRHSYVEVLRCAIPLYSDSEGENLILDASGIELRLSTGPYRDQILPTTRQGYQPQMKLRWEWSFDRKFAETWYREPMTGEMRQAFTSSATFVGEPISLRSRL